jgi:hypothetical protein
MNKRKLPYAEIAELYKSNTVTVENIADRYMTTTRTIQRIAKTMGVNITQAEANKRTAKFKRYYKKPEHLKQKRKHISQKLRFEILKRHPYCTICGASAKDGVRLEVDRKDDDNRNNERSNLQVLCNRCNIGKFHLVNSKKAI